MTPEHNRRADTAVADGLELVGLVREYGPDLIDDFLARRDRYQLEALVVALAAMVPDDRSVDELLAWIRPKPKEAPTTRRQLRPHGTHAAFMRHRAKHEEPCPACWTGERLYQRDAKRRQQAKRRAEQTTPSTTCTPAVRTSLPASTPSTDAPQGARQPAPSPTDAPDSPDMSTPDSTLDAWQQAS